METQYFEVYNQPNVELVDLRESPIERMAKNHTVLQTTSTHYDADVIIYATGFDAITGSLEHVRDTAGKTANSCTTCGRRSPPRLAGGIPNLFVAPAEHGGVLNMTRSTQRRLIDLINHMAQNGHTLPDHTTHKARTSVWVEEVKKTLADRLLFTKVSSSFTGRPRAGRRRPGRRCCTSAALPAYRDRSRKLRPRATPASVLE